MVGLLIILLLLFVIVPFIVGALLLIGFAWMATRIVVALLRLLTSIRVERR